MNKPNNLKVRVYELDENLELELKEIFDTVCQEFHLNADFMATELGCKCPFALIGFVGVSEDKVYNTCR